MSQFCGAVTHQTDVYDEFSDRNHRRLGGEKSAILEKREKYREISASRMEDRGILPNNREFRSPGREIPANLREIHPNLHIRGDLNPALPRSARKDQGISRESRYAEV